MTTTHSASSVIDTDKIIYIIEQHTGNNLSNYQPHIIKQAIYRRLQILQFETIDEYCQFARNNIAQESLHVQQTITSNISDFFRYPAAFNTFQQQLQQYLDTHDTEKPLRLWVANCMTGEEAYSLAICLLEYYKDHQALPHIDLIATDIDENNLTIAKQGIYKKSDLRYLSTERLRRFFIAEDEHYRCSPPLRNMISFTRHDLLRNPAFTDIDVILCRNTLYRFTPEAKTNAFHIFHQVLHVNGLLFTGEQDGLDNYLQLFTKANNHHAIAYNKPAVSYKEEQLNHVHHETHLLQVLNTLEELPSLIINASNEIVYLQGNLSPYLQTSADDFRLQACQFTDPNTTKALLKLVNYAKQYPEQQNQRFVQFIHQQKHHRFDIKAKAHTKKNSLYIVISFQSMNPPSSKATKASELQPPLLLEDLHQSVLKTREKDKGIVQKYNSLFMSNIVGVAECNAQGIVTEVNPFLCELFGEKKESILGQPVCSFISEEYKERVRYGVIEYATSNTSSTHHIELEGQTVKGESLWMEVSTFKIPLQHNDYHILVLVLDRTDRRQAQQLATAKHYELNRIMQANTAHEVASTLAHELNQPLAAIQNYLTGCKNYLKYNPDIDKLSYAIEQASQQLERTSNIIKHLKAYHSSDQSIALNHHFLNHIISETIELSTQLIPNQSFNFELDLDFSLPEQLLNPTQIEQLLINLINNAVRASQQASPSADSHTIVIKTYKLNSTTVCTEITDRGVGLPCTHSIFRPFFSQNKSSGGMGIGLAICRSIIEAHNGQIEAFNNSSQQGATIRFTLPLVDH